MAKLADNFKPGDVIYGLREYRKPFAMEALFKISDKLPADNVPWVVIDDYNNNTFMAGGDLISTLKHLEEAHRQKGITTV